MIIIIHIYVWHDYIFSTVPGSLPSSRRTALKGYHSNYFKVNTGK